MEIVHNSITVDKCTICHTKYAFSLGKHEQVFNQHFNNHFHTICHFYAQQMHKKIKIILG